MYKTCHLSKLSTFVTEVTEVKQTTVSYEYFSSLNLINLQPYDKDYTDTGSCLGVLKQQRWAETNMSDCK